MKGDNIDDVASREEEQRAGEKKPLTKEKRDDKIGTALKQERAKETRGPWKLNNRQNASAGGLKKDNLDKEILS